jgi:hypothetical protein
MNIVDLFHGIHVSDEYFTGGNISMGKKHQRLKMPGVENHVSDAAPVGSVASGFHFRMVQIASYHCLVLSDDRQAAEKRPSAAFPSSFVVAAYPEVRLTPQAFGSLASGHF